MDAAAQAIVDRLGPDVIGPDGAPIEVVVGQLLRERGWRVALAESCTGGLVASRLTDVAGSSDYVDRGVVAYSNEAKVDCLGVPADLIARHGAVSDAVARGMAEGMLARSRAQIAVGITGIAGPGGGSPEKPVGTVWLAVAQSHPPATRSAHCRFLGGREQVKAFAAVTALDLVRRQLMGAPWDIDWLRR
jgi:PncC family amidohydrolase